MRRTALILARMLAIPLGAQQPKPKHRTRKPPPVKYEPRKDAASTRSSAPAGASAQCRHGTYSFSAHRRGTCSHHVGVGTWM